MSTNVFAVQVEEKAATKKGIGRTDSEVEEDINSLKEWFAKQQHLPQNTGDQILERMLRLNKGSLAKTKRKLDTYYSIRNTVPEIFDDRSIFNIKMQKSLKVMPMLPYPKLTSELSRIFVARFTSARAEDFDIDVYVKHAFVIRDLCLHFDLAESEVLVVDCANAGFGHVIKFTLPLIKKLLTIFTKAYCGRINGIHLLYMPPTFASAVMFMRSILNNKLSSRVMVHTDLDSLHKAVPKALLPSDLGGDQISIAEASAKWSKYLERKNDWLLEQAKLRTNEKLRVGTPLADDFFGSVHGSFKSLNVD